MSSAIQFSGSFYVNDDASTTTRFTTFSLNPANRETMTAIQNRLGGGKPIQFTFQGSGLLDRLAELEDIACLGVINGAPRGNLGESGAAFFEAVARSGELVKITATLYDETERSDSGIITDLNANVQGSFKNHRIDFVFYPCDRLRFVNSSTYLSVEQDV